MKRVCQRPTIAIVSDTVTTRHGVEEISREKHLSNYS